MSDDEVTRSEFNMLISRIESLDRDGTRGGLALQQQMTDTIKDIAELKATFVAHEEVHKAERIERTNGRRWIIGMVIAGIAALGGLYGFLAIIFQHVKG